MLSREEQKKAMQKRIQDNHAKKDEGFSSGVGVLNFDVIGGYKKELIYKPKRNDYNRIDIIPYLVSSKFHPDKLKKGTPDYLLNVKVHRYIGPSNATVICLAAMYGKPCPICEEKEEVLKSLEGATKEEKASKLKPYNWSKRAFYCVIDLELPPEKQEMQIFEESHHLFEKELVMAAATRDGGFILFSDIEEGKSVDFYAEETTSPYGSFNSYKKMQFEDRKPYDEKVYEEAFPLDEMLIIPSYEEVRNIFYGVGEDTDEGTDDAPVEEEKSSRRRREEPEEKSSRRKREEPEEKSSRRERRKEEEPEEKTSRRGRGRREEKEENPCPEGLAFGKDNESSKACTKCPDDVWKKCEDEYHKLKKG
jgi:hypothetical protein